MEVKTYNDHPTYLKGSRPVNRQDLCAKSGVRLLVVPTVSNYLCLSA